MKTILTFFIFIITLMNAHAQTDSWKVTNNKTVLIETSVENEQKNILKLKKADLQKEGTLEIMYKDGDKQPDWRRYMAVFDEKDTELYKKENTACFKLSHQQILEWAKKAKTLHIFTWSLPNDPDLAARIRIRRIHLCTLTLN